MGYSRPEYHLLQHERPRDGTRLGLGLGLGLEQLGLGLGLEEVFVFDSKSKNRHRAVEAVGSVSEARAFSPLQR